MEPDADLGYRYIPCAPSPNPSPSLVFPFYRTLPAPPPTPPVHISWLDRSQFLRLSPAALTASTDRGYRSARANVAVRSGSWYFEVLIERGSGPLGANGGTGGDTGNAHIRVGWGRREANLDAPVGMDGYSYAIRDVGGEKVHLSRPKDYGRSFGTGDVVGCLINLPPRHDDLATIKRKRVPLRYKGQLYFEMEDYTIQKEMEALVDREGKAAAAAKAAAEAAKDAGAVEVKGKKGATTKNARKSKSAREPAGPTTRFLPTLDGSSIEFFLNGSSLETAFSDLYDFTPLPPLVSHTPNGKKHDPSKEVTRDDGTLGYYPMVSCFGKGKVRVNFGPPWLQPPPDLDARPMSERWEDLREEERLLDERDEEDSTERLIKEMKEDEVRRKAVEERLARLGEGSNGGTPRKKGKGRSAANSRKGMLEETPTPSLAPSPTPEAFSTPAPDGKPILGQGDAIDDGARVKMEVEGTGTPGISREVSVSSLAEVTDKEGVKSELEEVKDARIVGRKQIEAQDESMDTEGERVEVEVEEMAEMAEMEKEGEKDVEAEKTTEHDSRKAMSDQANGEDGEEDV